MEESDVGRYLPGRLSVFLDGGLAVKLPGWCQGPDARGSHASRNELIGLC